MIRFLTKSHLENRGIRGAFDGQRTKDHLRQGWRSDKLWSFTGETGKGPSEVDMRNVDLQELNIVERFDLISAGCNRAESIHLMVEAKKLSFADREKYMADPDYAEIPLEGMLSKAYAAQQAERIDFNRALTDVTSGMPEQYGDTTCFCVGDGQGNAVCMLQSLQSGFGSSLIAGDTGVLLNNRMTYWHLDADHPNCLMPGKRVRHTMNPVIITKGNRPFLICGTPGADTQVQTNLQLITHIIDFGMTPQEAVEAPRWRSLQNPMESTLKGVGIWRSCKNG